MYLNGISFYLMVCSQWSAKWRENAELWDSEIVYDVFLLDLDDQYVVTIMF